MEAEGMSGGGRQRLQSWPERMGIKSVCGIMTNEGEGGTRIYNRPFLSKTQEAFLKHSLQTGIDWQLHVTRKNFDRVKEERP